MWGIQEPDDNGRITTWNEITTIELLIQKLEDSFVWSEIFDKLDHAEIWKISSSSQLILKRMLP